MSQDKKEKSEKTADALKKEIASLRCKLGGFRTSNERYKKVLSARDKEVSELNEKMEARDKVIAGLEDQIKSLNSRIETDERNLSIVIGERDEAQANYEYVCQLPWYKRMFYNGK